MAQSEQLNELAAALVAAQAEFDTVSKDSTNPFFKSKYAGLPEVMKTAGPVLAKHGLAVSQFLTHSDGSDEMTTWLIHKSGQFINDTMRLHLVKDDPQGQGSATTYARRYSYMAVLGLVADEDDDGNAGSKAKPSTQVKPAEKPVQPPTPPTGYLIHPALMTELRLAFKDAQITGPPAIAFAKSIIDKERPTTNDEAQKLIEAVKGLME